MTCRNCFVAHPPFDWKKITKKIYNDNYVLENESKRTINQLSFYVIVGASEVYQKDKT